MKRFSSKLVTILVMLVFLSVPAVQARSTTTGASTFSAPADTFQAASPMLLAWGWAKTWGGSANESVHNLAVDGSGNLYVVGEFGGTVDFDPGSGVASYSAIGGQDVFLSKLDAAGAFQWARAWGGSGRDVPNGVGVDSSGNVYVSGPFQNTVDFNPDPVLTDSQASNAGTMNNVFLSKFAPDGTFQWAKTWGPSDGGSESYSLAVDGANRIYVEGDFTGTTTDFDPDPVATDWHTNHPGPLGNFDAFLSKFDVDGNFIWARTWGGEGYDDGPGVAVDSLGNVYVGGMYASTNINFDPAGGSGGLGHPAHDTGIVVDVFLSKFDADGNFQWVRTWGGAGADDAGEVVLVDGANNVYIAGRFKSINCDFNPGGTPDLHSSNGDHDAFISKFDPNGNFQWARTWGGVGWDATGSLAVDGANNVYSTGMFNDTVNFDPGGTANVTSNGGRDVFVTSFDAGGIFQWVKTWGGTGDDLGYHIAAAGAAGTYVVGSFSATTDFDPGPGVDAYTSNGLGDAFLSKFLPAATYTLSGNAGIGGAALSYTDGLARTVMADTSGNYTLILPENWSGTVTPSKTYYAFSPASRTYANVLANVTGESYTATPIPYTVTRYSTGAYDGWVLEASELNGRGGSLNATGKTFQLGDDALNRQYRAILSFDTSKLPAGAVIQSAVLRIRPFGKPVGGDPFKTLKPLLLDLKKGLFGKIKLEAADFQARSVKKVGTFAKQATGWYAAPLNATGIANLNRSGVTQFRLYFTKDDNNNFRAEYLKFFSGNNATNKPELVITYSVP